MTTQIKRLDFSKNTFEANGHTYKISTDLTVDRWQAFEKLQPKMGFGMDFETLYSRLSQAVDYANKGKGVEAWNIVLNLKESVSNKLENRMDTAMDICALFINLDGEDLRSIDPDLMQAKKNDWQIEGYSALDFFHLAANVVTGFVEALQQTSLSTLEEVKKMAAKKTKQK